MFVCAVDQGNRLTKYPEGSFATGIFFYGNKKPATRNDVLGYNGNYFGLDAGKRIPYVEDKTEDDLNGQNRFLILTLIAIAKQLEAEYAYIEEATFDQPMKIVLAIGTPPGHIERLKSKYSKYFKNGKNTYAFTWNDKQYYIRIANVFVGSQGYAVMMAQLPEVEKVRNYPELYIIDIGGYTTDYIHLIDSSVSESGNNSVPYGVNDMINGIQSEVSRRHAFNITESAIEAILLGKDTGLNDDIVDEVKNQAEEYAINLIGKLNEKKLGVYGVPCIFMGGGSLLFHEQLVRSNKLNKHSVFVQDITANAKGYRNMALLALKDSMSAKAAKSQG